MDVTELGELAQSWAEQIALLDRAKLHDLAALLSQLLNAANESLADMGGQGVNVPIPEGTVPRHALN